MEAFSCPACDGRVFFSNRSCGCGAGLVLDPDARRFGTAETVDACANRSPIGCNWRAESGGLCRSCAMTTTTPDLAVAGNAALWGDAEEAKRRVLANLMRWGLFTAADRRPPPEFKLLAEATSTGGARVTMGHADGVITIDVAEANVAVREARRADLEERFRTMAGHLRHELGHFLFMRLAAAEGFIDAFRELFGDETADYSAALERHYSAGPPDGWRRHHLTPYAAAHPHEDWAESVAHFLHLVDLTDSAASIGLASPALAAAGPDFDAYAAREPEPLLTIAAELGVAINHVNRSMGLHDLYPFVLTEATRGKLAFVQRWIAAAGG